MALKYTGGLKRNGRERQIEKGTDKERVCVCVSVCDDESAVQANNHALKSGTLKGECSKRGKRISLKNSVEVVINL